MKDLVASCAATFVESTALLDPSVLEYNRQGPEVVMAVHPNLDQITLLQTAHAMSGEVFDEVSALALEGCKAVGQHMRDSLLALTKQLAACRG